MDIIRYKSLDPITKMYDYYTTNVSRKSDVIINGEEWEYIYISGRLEWVQLKYEKNSPLKQKHKLYIFDKKTKQITYGREYESYVKEQNVVYDGVCKKFLVDQYGNNIGNLEIEYWIDGLEDGLFQSWNEKGILISKKKYTLGKLNGIYKTYCKNCGKIKFNRCYRDSLPIGEHISYDCQGKILDKTIYDSGTMKKVEYYQDGKLTEEEYYRDGQLIEN
jgi:antitoxin component YwqK of YwqJK toxin-antitoxin module|tara:strand:- start:430 stop:1086 length:657 start_codon:yes stop_codon:yes gene_type:complete